MLSPTYYKVSVRANNEITSLIREMVDNAPSSVVTHNAKFFLPFINRRMQSLLILLEEDLVWDAEIIMRSVVEATIKYSFILSNTEKIEDRSNEFWNDWAEVNSLEQSKRASLVLQLLEGKKDIKEHLSSVILDEEHRKKLENNWANKKIRQLKSDWSYGNMVRTLSKDIDLAPLIGLLHGYGMGSHLIHADETGIGIEAERLQRSSDEIKTFNTLHFQRILSDVIAFVYFFGHITAKALHQDTAQMRIISEQFNEDKKKT